MSYSSTTLSEQTTVRQGTIFDKLTPAYVRAYCLNVDDVPVMLSAGRR